MKNLIYLSPLLCILLLITSCTKDALNPGPNPGPGTGPSGCDSSQLVTYQLTNTTGIAGYVIAFSGQKNATFNFPANGTTTISVKPGTYNVFIYDPGNYTMHDIALNDQAHVRESGARYDSVVVTSCNGPQFVSITE